VETDQRGYIEVNDRLETNVPGIWAIGEVAGTPPFTHMAYDDFRILRDNMLQNGNRTKEGRLVPYTVFIDPQLGRVGLGEDEARQQGRRIKVAKMPMSSVARAIETGETRGMMKAVVDAESGEILGCAVLGMEGGEIMAMFEIAMMGKLTYQRLHEGIFAHPTLAESVNSLFSNFEGRTEEGRDELVVPDIQPHGAGQLQRLPHVHNGASQFGWTRVHALELRATQIGASERGARHLGCSQIALSKHHARQVSAPEVGLVYGTGLEAGGLEGAETKVRQMAGAAGEKDMPKPSLRHREAGEAAVHELDSLQQRCTPAGVHKRAVLEPHVAQEEVPQSVPWKVTRVKRTCAKLSCLAPWPVRSWSATLSES
jgi:hypothetical protein